MGRIILFWEVIIFSRIMCLSSNFLKYFSSRLEAVKVHVKHAVQDALPGVAPAVGGSSSLLSGQAFEISTFEEVAVFG